MPPDAVKTMRDLIYWQYSKLMSESAGYGKKDYSFIMDRYNKLQNGEIAWAHSIVDYLRGLGHENECIYCGNKTSIDVNQLIPQNRGGKDAGDNAILACKNCDTAKKDMGVYEWFSIKGRDSLPETVEGKYLKLLFDLHENKGTLEVNKDNLADLCDICEVGYLCTETKLTVYCLESILKTKPGK
jgi:hypothetical protein